MTIQSGTRLGPYLVEAPLGAGGMGEVYRGRDTRLDRPVAIKVLPSVLQDSTELRDRFEREARLLSSLNHPHICVVYDVGHQNGTSYLVMELLEGETLAARIARGPLHVQQATSIALQVGSALDRAHRVGVIHRDVKPENIMLTKSGAKLLDFGLAKPAPIAGDLAGGVTRTLPITGQGTILGTLQYMAPEQLEGKPADARSDIFAFGAVLYEMITGQRAFDGETPVSVISSIVRDTPRPITEIQPLVPASLDAIVRTCLEKDPDERWQSAHDLASQLRFIHQSGSQPNIPTPQVALRRRRYERATVAVLVTLAAVVGAVAARYLWTRPAPAAGTIRFSIDEPLPARFNPRNFASPVPAVSADGRQIVFSGLDGETSVLYLRGLNDVESKRLAGTEAAWLPFWSLDGRYIGFFADDTLKKLDMTSGAIETICRINGFDGGTWNRDNVVLFSKGPGGIFRVDGNGGEPVAVTTLDKAAKEVIHRAPVFMPDGRHFIYIAEPGNGVFFASIDGGTPRRLLVADARALFSPPGHLMFVKAGALFAQKFDPEAGTLSGEPIRIADSVRATPANGRAAFSVSDTGVLVYRSGDPKSTEVKWIDRTGQRETGIVLPPNDYSGIALSPDGRRVAFHRHDDPLGGGIWVKDLVRGDTVRLTPDAFHNVEPSWSPDSTRVTYTSERGSGSDVYMRLASGAGDEQLVLKGGGSKFTPNWSFDQRNLIYIVDAGVSQSDDIWIAPLAGGGKPTAFVASPVDEIQPQFSPDGKWVVYASSESDRYNVYVQPYPANGDRYSISLDGGIEPLWRADGREIFYLTSAGLLKSVSVTPGAGRFEVGPPQTLFEFDIAGLNTFGSLYQPAADGQRFLITERRKGREGASAEPLTVVINWTADLPQPQ